MTIVARFVSWVFHPLFLPTYAFFFILLVNPYLFASLSPEDRGKIFITIFINTTVFPVVVVFLMSKLKFIESVKMETRQDRILPYMAACLFYFWTFMVVKSLPLGILLSTIMLGASFAVFASFFLNLFYKISMHAVGAGCMFAVALLMAFTSGYNMELAVLSVLILAGIIGASRLYLQAHEPIEVYSGYLVGLVAILVAVMVYG